MISDARNKTVEAAERHNDPGTFTTFIGFEYTPTLDGRHLHRNVVFRGSRVPSLPFSSRNSENPEDLWTWLDALRMGLELEEKLGANPYQLGAVAASDSHTSASAYEEDNYFSNPNSPSSRIQRPIAARTMARA